MPKVKRETASSKGATRGILKDSVKRAVCEKQWKVFTDAPWDCTGEERQKAYNEVNTSLNALATAVIHASSTDDDKVIKLMLRFRALAVEYEGDHLEMLRRITALVEAKNEEGGLKHPHMAKCVKAAGFNAISVYANFVCRQERKQRDAEAKTKWSTSVRLDRGRADKELFAKYRAAFPGGWEEFSM